MLITIKSERMQAVISSNGAELQSLQFENKERLWQGDPAFWTGRAPLLFPCVGALRDKKARIGEKEYALPQHGFARRSAFEVKHSAPDAVCFLLRANEETRTQYPFDFTLEACYRVKCDTLVTSLTVSNRGEGLMPFAIGGHPAFFCPINPGEAFEEYALCFEKKETADCPRVVIEKGMIDMDTRRRVLDDEDTLPLRHELFDNDALIFGHLHSEKVAIRHQKTGEGVELEFSGFPYLGIWQPMGAPFVCLEPWTGMATCLDESDEFSSKRGMRLIRKGESMTLSFSVRMLSAEQ